MEIFIDVKRSQLDFSTVDILAAFTPILAASLLVYKEEGRSGVTILLKRIFDFSRITKKIWYVPVILLPFLIYFLIYIILYLIGVPLPDNIQIHFKSISFLFILFFIGAVCEEVGYMGYGIYFTTYTPGFIWKGTTSVFTARDMYIAEKGRLVVSLLSLINVVDATVEQYNQDELLRWLAESV